MNKKVSESTSYRFIGISKSDKSINWQSFLSAANIDYVSFFMQYHIGIIPVGTVAWMIQQTIEKYCKALLNKVDSSKYTEKVLSKRPYSHNLIRLWNEVKSNTTQFSYEITYDDLIKSINQITTSTRYMNHSTFFGLGLIESFTVLGCEFRYEIIGKNKFHNSFFGLNTNSIFTSRYFLNNYNFEILFKKLMHMSIEHGISFSAMLGIPDTYESTHVNLSKATAKFCQCGIHKEIEKNCPKCKNIIWSNGIRNMKEDSKILSKYFANFDNN